MKWTSRRSSRRFTNCADAEMNRLAVINVVGLTEALIGEHTPRIAEFRQRGALAQIAPAFPAVTCTAQSNYLTGAMPSQHGIVGNGWYHRELAEVQFWKQSNHIVHGEKIWDELRAACRTSPARNFSGGSTCIPARIIPSRRARCIPPMAGSFSTSIHSRGRSAMRSSATSASFRFFGFWGPAAGIDLPQGKADCASRWIATRRSGLKQIRAHVEPDLPAASGLQLAATWPFVCRRRGDESRSQNPKSK